MLSDSDYLVYAMEVTALLRIIDESYMIIDKKEHKIPVATVSAEDEAARAPPVPVKLSKVT